MLEQPKKSAWRLTLKLERANGKVYTKHISSRSSKLFIYVTFVAALWTTSAYVFFYVNDDSEVQTMKAMEYLNELAQLEAKESLKTNIEVPADPQITPSPVAAVAPLEAAKINDTTDAGFTLEDTALNLSEKTATVHVSLRKTSNKAEIEGKIAGILVLKDSATGTEHRVSSRPGFIPLTPEKSAIEARGLYFRAKHRVQKQLSFQLPKDIVFDEVKAELSAVTKDGFKTIDVFSRDGKVKQPLKIGNSGAPAPSIH